MIQLNTLEDRSVPDKEQWDKAVKFMEETMKEKLSQGKYANALKINVMF